MFANKTSVFIATNVHNFINFFFISFCEIRTTSLVTLVLIGLESNEVVCFTTTLSILMIWDLEIAKCTPKWISLFIVKSANHTQGEISQG